MKIEILFLPLILWCYNPKVLKNHTPLCLLLSFCATEYFVCITMNKMRGQPIILHLLICLFYLLQLNIISLTVPKPHQNFLYLPFAKWNFVFTLRKNWSGQNRSSRTDSAGSADHALCLIKYILLCSNLSDKQSCSVIGYGLPIN